MAAKKAPNSGFLDQHTAAKAAQKTIQEKTQN